jgi:hypothetical protein
LLNQTLTEFKSNKYSSTKNYEHIFASYFIKFALMSLRKFEKLHEDLQFDLKEEGNKILNCLKELGEKEVWANNLGIISNKERNFIIIESSKDYFLTNYSIVGNILKELQKENHLREICSSIPFDVRQAEHLISMTDFNWEDFAKNKQLEGQVSLFDVFEEEVTEEVMQKEQEIADSFIPVVEPEIGNEVKENTLETKTLIETINTEGEKDIITEIIDNKIRETYPANIEGSKEFNQANGSELKQEIKSGQITKEISLSKIDQPVFNVQIHKDNNLQENKESVTILEHSHIVYLDEKLQYQVVSIEELPAGFNKEILTKGNYKHCYSYILDNL